jgi:hypothetical protein
LRSAAVGLATTALHHLLVSARVTERLGILQEKNVDFVTKFEKALRKRYQHLKTEMAKIEHLIDAFEKGAKRGAKPTGRGRLSAAGRRRISLAQKARWAKKKKG